MSRFVIDIPHVSPQLDIEYNNDEVMQYLFNVFSPYTSLRVNEYPDSQKIVFHENTHGEVFYEVNEGLENCYANVIRFVEKYLVTNTKVEPNYLMLHGGGIVYKENAFLFLGSSMAGKSTLIAYLSLEGFEYLTDDRLIINVEEQTVIPYTKKIILRETGKAVIAQKTGNEIATESFRYKNVHKELFSPRICRERPAKISQIYILSRQEEGKVSQIIVDEQNRIYELLKHSLSVKECRHISKFAKLSKIPMKILSYSEMEDISKIIKCMVC